MARRLGSDLVNTLQLHDNLSGTDIEFRYRMPTSKERTQYANFAVQRHRNRVELKVVEAQMKFGAAILVGIREGDFEVPDGKKWKHLSSDPDSKNYREDWKALVCDMAPELVQALGNHVFERSVDYSPEGPEDDLEKN